MTKSPIRILQLYPTEMNMYGDYGNVLCLKKRLEWRGYDVHLLEHHPGKALPKDVDIITGGGGQDAGQMKIKDDLQIIGSRLHALARDGTPMLMICGLYQLFGRFFKTKDGTTIPGIEIFNAETHAGPKRLIGNITTHSEQFGDIIGYENHSGLTYLDKIQLPLGRVTAGNGNNDRDTHEGARYKNVIGTYLHGSLLPKNPLIADFLILQALQKKYDVTSLDDLSSIDSKADLALTEALTRPR